MAKSRPTETVAHEITNRVPTQHVMADAKTKTRIIQVVASLRQALTATRETIELRTYARTIAFPKDHAELLALISAPGLALTEFASANRAKSADASGSSSSFSSSSSSSSSSSCADSAVADTSADAAGSCASASSASSASSHIDGDLAASASAADSDKRAQKGPTQAELANAADDAITVHDTAVEAAFGAFHTAYDAAVAVVDSLSAVCLDALAVVIAVLSTRTALVRAQTQIDLLDRVVDSDTPKKSAERASPAAVTALALEIPCEVAMRAFAQAPLDPTVARQYREACTALTAATDALTEEDAEVQEQVLAREEVRTATTMVEALASAVLEYARAITGQDDGRASQSSASVALITGLLETGADSAAAPSASSESR